MILNKNSLLNNFTTFKRFLTDFGFKPVFFILAVLLSLAAAFFEGITAGLLIPFAKGVIERNFSFMNEISFLHPFLSLLPKTISNSSGALFALLLFTMFFSVLLKNILGYFSSISVLYQVRSISNSLRKIIFNRYLNFGKLFFDGSSIGYLTEVLMGFTQQISGQLSTIHQFLTNFFMLIIYFTIMFVISWKLTLIVLLTFPSLYYSLKWLIKKIGSTSHYQARARANLSKKIFNVLTCILFVKACSKEKEEKNLFSNASELVAKTEFSMDKKWYLAGPIQEIVLLLMLILLAICMAFLVTQDHSVGLPALVAYLYVLRKSGASFTFFNYAKISFAQVSGPIDGIRQILSDADKYFEVEGAKEFKEFHKNIKFNHLNFYFANGSFALNDVTFSIEKSQTVAVVGASGAGKTTLINLILRFYNNPPNSLLIDGVDINEYTLKSYRSKTALVSQDTALFNDTLRANILYGLDRQVSEEELSEVLKKARLYDFIVALPEKLETLIGDRGVKLSGGEKQRVAIARAMLRNVEILILDEATSALDSKTEKLIQESIDYVIKDKTAVVIAHRLSTIKNADKIVVIEKGCLIEEGTLHELLDKKGKFYEYWEEQKFF